MSKTETAPSVSSSAASKERYGARLQITVPNEELEGLCREHGIRQLSFFGSVLRDDFTPASDVDVLVEFVPDRIPGLFRFARIERELSHLLGREVDLHTPTSLSPYLRERVLQEAQPQYVAA